MEKGFVFLDEAIPGIRWDAKYMWLQNQAIAAEVLWI